MYYLPVKKDYQKDYQQVKRVSKIIVSKELLQKMKLFGLNSYEARVWTALLSRGISTAGELSDIANVPRSRTYDILESLEKKGFVLQKVGKPIKYIAISPEEVIERLKKKIKEDAKEREKMLEKMKDTKFFEELKLLHSKGIELLNPTEIVTSVRGRAAIADQVFSMLKNCEKSLKMCLTPSTCLYIIKRLKDSFENAKKNGIDIKIVLCGKDKTYLTTIKNEVGFLLLKYIENLNARFVIADEKEALFLLLEEKDTHEIFDPGIWVSSALFSSTLSNFFDVLWKNAKEL